MTQTILSILEQCPDIVSRNFSSRMHHEEKEILFISDDLHAIREFVKFYDRAQSGFSLRCLKNRCELDHFLSEERELFSRKKPCAVILDPQFEKNYGYCVMGDIRERAKEKGILFVLLSENFSDLYLLCLYDALADAFVTKPVDDILLSYVLERSKVSSLSAF